MAVDVAFSLLAFLCLAGSNALPSHGLPSIVS